MVAPDNLYGTQIVDYVRLVSGDNVSRATVGHWMTTGQLPSECYGYGAGRGLRVTTRANVDAFVSARIKRYGSLTSPQGSHGVSLRGTTKT